MMHKVIGCPSYKIMVTCPQCGFDYDLASDNHDDEYEVQRMMFTNTQGSCTNMNFLCTCPLCEEDFILDSLEY